MNAARTLISTLAILLAMGAARSAAAQAAPDYPTGGTSAVPYRGDEEITLAGARDVGGPRIELAGITTLVARVRSGVLLYRWISPLTTRHFTSSVRGLSLSALPARRP